MARKNRRGFGLGTPVQVICARFHQGAHDGHHQITRGASCFGGTARSSSGFRGVACAIVLMDFRSKESICSV